jgi:hypothetical protein
MLLIHSFIHVSVTELLTDMLCYETWRPTQTGTITKPDLKLPVAYAFLNLHNGV